MPEPYQKPGHPMPEPYQKPGHPMPEPYQKPGHPMPEPYHKPGHPMPEPGCTMKLHCLGTAGYHPSEHRQTACYFIPDEGIVLDAGSAMFRLGQMIKTETIDILLSHAHLDHVMGLTFLHDILTERPVDVVRVWGEREKLAAVRDHLLNELIFPAPLPVQWMEIIPGRVFSAGLHGRLLIDTRVQEHPGGSIAYRLRWPAAERKLVYATDTTGDLSEESIAWMEDADLLMHECSFRDSEEKWAIQTGHSWPSKVATLAREADVRRLLLIHINPKEQGPDPIGLDKVRSIYGDAMIAWDGMTVDL
jgi:ribonuclease BN (tRNA processing enzyme)